jgi:hypothetical protein
MAKVRKSSALLGKLIHEAIDQLEAEDFAIWYEAHQRLLKYGASAAQVIAERLINTGANRNSRRRLLEVLSELGPSAAPSALALVSMLIADADPFVASVIAVMGPAADKVMPDLLGAFPDASAALRPLLVNAIGGIGTRANVVVPLLLQRLEQSADDEKIEILGTLANYGRNAAGARSQIERILQNIIEKTEIKQTAAYALARIAPDVDTQMLLVDLLESTLNEPGDDRFGELPHLADVLAVALSNIQDVAPFVGTRIHHLLDQKLQNSPPDLYRDPFPYSVPYFVNLVEAHAPSTAIAVDLLRRLYLIGRARQVDHDERRRPLTALARIGESAADALVEVAAAGDSYAFDVLGDSFVDRDFAAATIRRILREAPDGYGENGYGELAARMLENLQPPDFELLNQLARHRNRKVRNAAKRARKRAEDLTAGQKPLQIRVIQPSEVPPEVWSSLNVIVHTSEVLYAIESAVQRRLRKAASRRLRATRAVEFKAASDQLPIVPDIPGFEVNPNQLTFERVESVHEFYFRIRTSPGAQGAAPDISANGKVYLYCGALLVAEVPISIFVNSELKQYHEDSVFEADAATFDTVFVSYAREDVSIVEQVERVSSV